MSTASLIFGTGNGGGTWPREGEMYDMCADFLILLPDALQSTGIGFYAEELLLQWGYFDDSPHLRKTMFTYMRLRALRCV